MTYTSRKILLLFLLMLLSGFSPTPTLAGDGASLLEVTPNIRAYATSTVKPALDSFGEKDTLSLLLKVNDVLIDSRTGVRTNSIEPSKYIIYDKLDILKLGFLITLGLSSKQKEILKSWHSKFMKERPADVFFAPSADEIVKTKAAFGCSHYARSFIAVVKALGLVEKPQELRYAISSKGDDYNLALERKDKEMTINGHQFVLVNINSEWIAINTSRSEWTALPGGFSPESIHPPRNIPIRFASYPEVVFLLRKVGKNYNDDCSDRSLAALMNIYRSGDPRAPDFRWERFEGASDKSTLRD